MGSRAGAPRRGNRRRLGGFGGEFQSAVGQTAQEQFELSRVQLLALFPEAPAGQGIELLAQQRVLPPGLFQRLLQGRHLLAQGLDFLLQRNRVHLNC